MKSKPTDIEILDACESGLNLKEAAEMFNLAPSTISRKIATLQAEQGVLLQYRKLHNLHLTKLKVGILEQITPEKLAEASLKDLASAYKIFNDAERVDEGKPTEIKGMIGYLLKLEEEKTAAQAPVTININVPTEDEIPEL